MAHNYLTKDQLGFFYQNRKKLDTAIGQILGPGVHLHDISRSSDNISTNSYGLKNPQKKIDASMLSVNSGGPNKVQQYGNDIFSNSTENKVEKLTKQNIGLEKKIITLKDENQKFKSKSSLWQKTKLFIINNLNKQLKLNSIKYHSSDSAILDQFLSKLENIINNKQFFTKIEQDHKLCEQQKRNIQKKLEQENKLVQNLSLEIEYLKTQNDLLKNKQNEFTQSLIKDDQINILKKQINLLTSRIDQLTNSENKMKKVISLAQNLNNQFLKKLEHELKKSRTTIQTSINEYGQSKKSLNQTEESFHFSNRKFKIVKSRSVQKQRFMYGQKNKDNK